MRSVVDASFILDFLLPDEQSAHVIQTFEEYKNKKSQISLVAPIILPFEVANGLKYAVKSKRIKETVASELLEAFFQLNIGLLQINLEKAFQVSLENELSIYDASYIILSHQENLPLLTLDEKLKKLRIT